MSARKAFLSGAMVVLPGLMLVALLFWLSVTAPAQASPAFRCVNQSGTGCAPICGGCYASVQAAVNAANPGDVIRIAGGTYTDPNGTVVAITKGLNLVGGFDPTCTNLDPHLYPTTLDGQWSGSVISITNASDVMLEFLIITHGDGTGNYFSALGCGGGIYARDTNLHVGDCVITNNVGSTLGGGVGGGICARDSNVEIWGSAIVSNTASTDPSSTFSAYGGGVYVESSIGAHTVLLRESQFLDNVGHVSSQAQGGGIYLLGLTGAEVLTNTIRGNRATISNATGGWGGGLYVENCSGVYVTGNRIESNVTHPNPAYAGYGGGVCVQGVSGYGGDVHLARNTIISNSASEGGGVFIRSEHPVTLTNNLIARNSHNGAFVVEYYAPGVSRALLVNNTIADNGSNGIVAEDYAVVTLTNNLIAGHTMMGLEFGDPFSGTVSADHNLFWNTADPFTGTNGIRQDPLLRADYRLHAGSPAVDAGLTIPWLTTDLEGKPRTPGAYDIGAFEGAWWETSLPLVMRNR